MRCRARGIILVEVLLIVAIVGILAFVVVPEFSSASTGANEVLLQEGFMDLQAAVDRYRDEHDGQLPDPERLEELLTGRSNAVGDIAPSSEAADADYPFGPYIERIPPNPFVNEQLTRRIEIDDRPAGGANAGWHYNPRTGQFAPDDMAHTR